MLAVDAGEILGVFGHDLQQVVRRPGHQVAFQDVGHLGHLTLKGVQQVIGLALQGDFDKDHRGFAQSPRVQKGDVTGDVALFFQPLGAAVAGTGRQVHAFRKLGIGDAAILLQDGQDAAVGCVQIHDLRSFFRQFPQIPQNLPQAGA